MATSEDLRRAQRATLGRASGDANEAPHEPSIPTRRILYRVAEEVSHRVAVRLNRGTGPAKVGVLGEARVLLADPL